MKYMGSKRAMLLNGLGELLELEVARAGRFVDLFTGSGVVARHVAQRYAVPVLASDLQAYSVALAGAVVERRRKLSSRQIWQEWLLSATMRCEREVGIPSTPTEPSSACVARHRLWCERQRHLPITSAYGGHYFSAQQAVWIDSLRASLPLQNGARLVCLAALIQAASSCAASPGHTAQPFQPTPTALKYIFEAWRKDPLFLVERNLERLCEAVARKKGKAKRADANSLANELNSGDLVFIDPPYSGVHYSRFYHVLESIASGAPGEVSGVGRYPRESKRPRSRYSVQTEAAFALDQLFGLIAEKGARAIVTFPDHKCSNGLSGELVRTIAGKYFFVDFQLVESKFSSLGGTSDGRGDEGGRKARNRAQELILTLSPHR